MKKRIILFVIIIAVLLSGCGFKGYDFVDTNYHFDYAYIRMPDGTNVLCKIKSWSDSDDGEQLTITTTDGTRYLVNSVNCVLVEKPQNSEERI